LINDHYALGEQVFLLAVFVFKASRPGVDGYQAGNASPVLVMTCAKREHFHVRSWFGSAVNMVNRHDLVELPILETGNATDGRDLGVKALFSG
jgi:hypothetical protein